MKLPAHLVASAQKFDALSLRERLLVLGAALVVLSGAAHLLLMAPIDARRKALTQEVTDLASQLSLADKGVASGLGTEPTNGAAAKLATLQTQLKQVDSQLLAQSAGMISPDHMADTVRDVLRLQRGVVLVSLRNLPPGRLPPELDKTSDDDQRLYVHTIELVLEGHYLDVLDYLRTLEALPWHFYWRELELTTTHYPTNRVRLELGTFSAERDWMDL